MVIKNSTPWSTDDLRALFRRCVKEVEAVERPQIKFHQRNKRFQLDLLNTTRHSGCNGRATVGGYWIMLKLSKDWSIKTELPTQPDEVDTEYGYNIYKSIRGTGATVRIPTQNPDDIKNYPHYWKVVGEVDEMSLEHRRRLAEVMIHEYHHTIGYGHVIDSRNYSRDPAKRFNLDWVESYPIRRKTPAVKPVRDVQQVRYQQAITNLRGAETRLKRAKTIHKKWLHKVRYYEKVAASKQP